MTAQSNELHRIPCPKCDFQFDPVEFAKLLTVEVLTSERARRNGLKPRPRHAGPGRPKGVARCPSCPRVLPLAEFQEHFLPCLTATLQQIMTSAQPVQVKPMDPTQYRDFKVMEIQDETVRLYKLSNMQYVDTPLRAIREITPSVNGDPAIITLRGGIRWREDIQRWRFSTD